jgi:1-acyl-sn-glycerol-3-phosphate acyltransferase
MMYVREIIAPLSTGVFILFFGIRLSVQITGNFPPRDSYKFLIMTHSSTLDFMVVTSAHWLVHRSLGAVSCLFKKELVKIPFFGPLQLVVGSVPVGRSGDVEAAKASLAISERRAREGYLLGGFPEGTRRRAASCGRDQIQPLKKGMFHVAASLNRSMDKPVCFVPLVMMGGNAAWPANQLVPIVGSKVTVRMGDVITMRPDETVDEITNRMRSTLQDEIERSGAVCKGNEYSSDAAFDNGIKINLWKAYGFETVMMALPLIITISLGLAGLL